MTNEERIAAVVAHVAEADRLYDLIDWAAQGKCECCGQDLPPKDLAGYAAWSAARAPLTNMAVALVLDGICSAPEAAAYAHDSCRMVELVVRQRREKTV